MYEARWNQKPPIGTQLDASVPLARGLVAFWPLWEGGGVPSEAVGRSPANSCNASWTATPYGRGLLFNGTNQWVAATGSSLMAFAGTITIAAFTSPATGLLQVLVGGEGWVLGVDEVGSNEVYFYTNAAGFTTSSSNAIDGTWHLLAVTQSSTGPGGVQFYRDGNPWGTGTLNSLPASTLGALSLGANSSGTNHWLNGSMGWAAVWSRALSSNEHMALAANPWQVFRPQCDAARLNAAASGRRVSYPRGSSALRPLHLPTADLYGHLD